MKENDQLVGILPGWVANHPVLKEITLPLPKECYAVVESSTCTAFREFPVPVHVIIDDVE